MVRAIILIVTVAVVVVISLIWYLIDHRNKVAAREQERLDQLQSALHVANLLLYNYTPGDAIGDGLERQAREIFVNYHTALSLSGSRKQHLAAAQTAHQCLALLISEHPQGLFAPSDDVSRTFVRKVFSALFPIQPKEIPHVP